MKIEIDSIRVKSQNNCFFSCLCCIIILYFYIYPNAVTDPDTRILGDPDTRDPDARCTLSMDENRLKAFEDMLAANLAENCIPNKMTTMDDSYS